MSDNYRYGDTIAIVEELEDLPGARLGTDRLGVTVEDSVPLDVADDIERLLGTVRPEDNSVWTITTDSNDPMAVDPATGTVWTVAQESPVELADGQGVTVEDDATAPQFPVAEAVGHDLTNATLELGPLDVNRAEAAVLSASAEAGWSATIEWLDANGNVFQTEQATDIGLDNVAEGWTRLVRKGTHVKATLTDESGSGSNTVNAFLDTHA